MTRLRMFEELGLTHTCCRKPLIARKAYKGETWSKLDEDEVEEIRDEEKELIITLESELHNTGLGSDLDFDEAWQEEICKLLDIRARNASCLSISKDSDFPAKVSISLKCQGRTY